MEKNDPITVNIAVRLTGVSAASLKSWFPKLGLDPNKLVFADIKKIENSTQYKLLQTKRAVRLALK
ncbi:hypothetical protein [Aeoliella sp.]|uniref:hypothetical protein n=1 Tax=Aeoliella sp. TaxID=2795800 RepID=UPI003CCB916A